MALSVGEKPSLVALKPGWYQSQAASARLSSTTVVTSTAVRRIDDPLVRVVAR